MRILVLGGSGFLGQNVVEELVGQGHKVTVYDKKKSTFLKEKIKYVVADILDEKKIEAEIKKNDYVYNFAGISDISISKNKPQETFEQNVVSTINILKLCLKYKIRKFLYASTVYVHSNKGFFYQASKQCAEIYIKEFNRTNKLNYTIIRFGSLYGPRSGKNNGLYQLIEKILKKNVIEVNDLESKREYIHVIDAAKASVTLLNKKFDNQSIVVSGQEIYSIKDIIEIISEIIDKKLKIKVKKKIDYSSGHYKLTPYNFKDTLGKKYTLPFHVDLGQGIIDLIEQIKIKNN